MTALDRPAGSYRRLFEQPGLRGLAVADLAARLPQGMVSITLLLVAAQRAPFTTAGLAAGAYALGQALTAPVRGRLADRRGLRMVVPCCLAGYVLALAGFAVAARLAPSALALVGGALLAGLSTPPLSPAMRGLWAVRTPPELRRSGLALDAAVFDLTAIAGPALAGVLATRIAPNAALAVQLVLMACAAAVVSRQPGAPGRAAPASGKAAPAGGGPGPLRVPALRRLLVTAALANLALTMTEVALTAFARRQGAAWAAGPLLAALSVGSVAGSLLLGRLGERGRSTRRRLPLLLAGYALGLAVLAAAGLRPPLLAVAAPAAGLCLGPTLAALFTATADAAPAAAAIEAQSWVNTVMSGGSAAGAALAGLAAARPLAAVLLAAAAAALAAATALPGRGGSADR